MKGGAAKQAFRRSKYATPPRGKTAPTGVVVAGRDEPCPAFADVQPDASQQHQGKIGGGMADAYEVDQGGTAAWHL